MKFFRAFHSRAAWPPTVAVALFVILYAMLAGTIWAIERLAPNGQDALAELPELARTRTILLITAAGAFAIYRLARFHPVWNRGYAAWLRLSPWTAERPLPLGPVHLVWQDLVVLGLLTAIAAGHKDADLYEPVAAFVLVYLVGWSVTLAFTRTWASCLWLGFLWPALLLPVARTPWAATVLVLALVGVLWHGHRVALRSFPWPSVRSPTRSDAAPAASGLQVEVRIPGLSDTPAVQATTNVGWPYSALSPKVGSKPIPTAVSLSLSLLLGWWLFCIVLGFDFPPGGELVLLFALVAALLRLGIYCSGLQPPFSLAGRLSSGRLVLPGYDQVFLTPAAVGLLGLVGTVLIKRSGAWYALTESGVLALVSFVLLAGGPTLRNWHLTGHHRYRLPKVASSKLIRPV
jgi:hypothetical protein